MSQHISIVGGGMVGASLALALQQHAARRGWRINLIEAQPPARGQTQPSFDARSTALSHGSYLLFEQLGIWAELAGQAEPIRQIHVSDRGHPLAYAKMIVSHLSSSSPHIVPNLYSASRTSATAL